MAIPKSPKPISCAICGKSFLKISSRAQNCPACRKTYMVQWRAKNAQKLHDYRKKHYSENREKYVECARKNYIKDRERRIRKSAQRHKRLMVECPEKTLDRLSAYAREWRIKNSEKVKSRRHGYYQKWVSDPANRLSNRISRAMRHALKDGKTGRGWETLVGYTRAQLAYHLERQFLPGMSWKNMGEWHIDHIVPISAFNFSNYTSDEFQRCWALSNLRPLWAEDNLRKGSKIAENTLPRKIRLDRSAPSPSHDLL